MTSREAIEYIEDFTWSTTRLGLDRTRILLERLGNPQNQLKFVHVAGSNGKGSACAMISSVLKESGYKTGLYTSPYLVDFSEQLCINGKPISGEELAEIVERVRPEADAMEDHPSRFELLTAVGMLYFLENHCDIVVLEVGMGGLMDSTNIIPPPLCAVLMNIGLEHCEYLGNTLEEIAETKGGIIKHGCTTVSYESDERVTGVLQKICREKEVPFIMGREEDLRLLSMDLSGILTETIFGQLKTPLIGRHQVKNIAVVLKVLEILKNNGFDMDSESIKRGFENVNWPARFQVLRKEPLFILDGAHNPQCVEALDITLKEICPERKFTFLAGVLADKDYVGILNRMIPHANKCICVTPENPRALPAEDLAREIGDRVPTVVCKSVKEGIELALRETNDVLTFGSLYLAGDVLKYFGPM